MNIADALERNRLFFPDHEAIVFGGRTWTYAQFWDEACRVAGSLRSLGVRKGDKVIRPMGQTRIEEGDVIALFALAGDVPEVERLMQVSIDFF